MSTTASDVATTALSGGRVQLLINVGNSVAEAVTKYLMSLLGPEKRLELGAWIAVTINALDNNFINPPKPQTQKQRLQPSARAPCTATWRRLRAS